MGQNSTIEWTDHTFNPWWGCTKVSLGCKNCYAEAWADRYGHKLWGDNKPRRFFSDQHWQEPIKWNSAAKLNNRRSRVFCASMADVFEDNNLVVNERAKLWSLIEHTRMLDWLLLTKRPENMLKFTAWQDQWPSNVWAMTSVEDQEQAEARIPYLLRVPAIVKGLSVEPLLTSVDLSPWIDDIQWVIVGGESGRYARPLNPDWVRQIRDTCKTHNVAFFFKQWGEWAPVMNTATNIEEMQKVGKKKAGRVLDNDLWNQLPNICITEAL